MAKTTVTLKGIAGGIRHKYFETTPKRVQVIDAYLAFTVLTVLAQFVYCGIVGTFPFNSFLSGFFSGMSSFALAVGLRLQVTNQKDFDNILPERAFAEFVFCHILLHFVVFTFMG